MKIRSLHAAAAACALSVLPATLHAQVGRPIAQPQNAPVQSGQVQPDQIIQPGQVVPPGQAVKPGQTIRNGNVINPQGGRPVQSNSGKHQSSHSVENFLVKKMMLCNKAEIELGQIAVDKAKSDEVKQFAEMLVQEHQQLNQKLSQTQAPSQPDQGQQVPQQLTTIVQDAHAKQLEMAREMLNNEEGQDFDMAYLGMKIASHAAALAELQAIQNVGSQEFQQLVRTTEKKTSDHLERAKELANNLKDKKDR
jgi:putative membrane protein